MDEPQNISEPLLAAIDLGSNSFHLMIAKSEFGELRPVQALAEKVQLGETSSTAILTQGAIERGLACLERFKQLIDSTTPAKLRIVGTNALRRAKNRQDFIEPAEQILGAPIEVIYGREEARLIYLGVAHTLSDDEDTRLVVDIGGGTSESALLSLGGVVALEAVRVGSFDIDSAIQAYVRREYGLAIGERTAEEIKWTIGSAASTPDEGRAEVKGRELMSGLPKTVVLSPVEIRRAIEEPVAAMVESVVQCLAQAPPELAQDLMAHGICLVGGGSLLRGLDVRIAEDAGVPVVPVETPMECVVLGAGHCIESFEAMRVMFMEGRR